jgi:hypothetical protein
MGRPDPLGFPPLRNYWRDIVRHDLAAEAQQRQQRKARDRNRAKCRCDAYKFPASAAERVVSFSGSVPLCVGRMPKRPRLRPGWRSSGRSAENRPRSRWTDLVALTTKPHRPYNRRYAGLRRQLIRASGLHPINDRKLIDVLMPRLIESAKQLKRANRRLKYRNMRLSDVKVTGNTISFQPAWGVDDGWSVDVRSYN